MDAPRPGGGLPAAVGRYEVIAHLDSGGMAQILLGRLTGPSGFERYVVIKRILPGLADDPSFVEMFLDEARLVASVRHPNVVHVQELVSEGGDLFLVMEYLEGETAAALLRRLGARGERLSPALSAYIAAQVCAGLHAAHEITSPDGKPLGVVHRDVSPSNIFITYDGAVKILDFGVAKAADRMAATEAGQLKGKLAYMSPEQAHGADLDRRADVYALGVVLYELGTGRNPLRRATDVQTLQALGSAPIEPPSRLVPGYPPQLEAVCLRALARDRDARYPTAADMRRDLLAAVQASGEATAPEETLARLMQASFAERQAARREMLRRASSSAPGARPIEALQPASATSVATTSERPAPRRRPRALVPVLVVVAALGVAAAAWRLARTGGERAQPAGACPSRAIRIAKLSAAWTTPNAIRWQWDAEGSPDEFVRYELAVGPDRDAVAARARTGAGGDVRVWTDADNPELGRFRLPRTESVLDVRGTTTTGHAPDALHYAALVAVDVRHCRAVSDVVAARTAIAPFAEVVLYHDDLPAASLTLPRHTLAVTDQGPHHAGSRRHLEFRSTCPDGQAACWENLRVELPQTTSLLPGHFSQAFLELAVSCTGTQPSYYSDVALCFGGCDRLCREGACDDACLARCEQGGGWEFAPVTVACREQGGYGVVQIPLRALKAAVSYGCRRPSPCQLRPDLVPASAIRFWLGGLWPRDAVVRIDEVRLRW